MKCERCTHPTHVGRMCGGYNTRTVRDDVSFSGYPPSGKEWTFIESICRCITVGVLDG